MEVLAGIGVVFVMLITLAATFAVYPALWKGFRAEWRRIPTERRPRAIVGGAATLMLICVFGALAIAQPWGPRSIVYVILIGGGGLMVLVLAAVGVQAVLDVRRVRRAREEDG